MAFQKNCAKGKGSLNAVYHVGRMLCNMTESLLKIDRDAQDMQDNPVHPAHPCLKNVQIQKRFGIISFVSVSEEMNTSRLCPQI
jgi:hypothetical protein